MKDLEQKVPEDWERRRQKAIENPKENSSLDWDIRQKNFLSANWLARNNKRKLELKIKEKTPKSKEKTPKSKGKIVGVYTKEALKILNMARSTLMDKKTKGKLKEGIHWFSVSKKKRALLMWNIPEIQKCLEEEKKYKLTSLQSNFYENQTENKVFGPFISRKLAKEKGLKYYFTGIPCNRGHIDERHVYSFVCRTCKKINDSSESNKRMRNKSKQNWRSKNKELNALMSRNSTRINNLIKRGLMPKGEFSKSRSLGCNSKELVVHIESQFTEGMSWQRFKEIQIDHVRPINSFNLFDTDEERKVCFNYRNLQPLWREENLSKSDRYTKADEINWVERMKKLGYNGKLFLKY